MAAPVAKSGIAYGANAGHITARREEKPRATNSKGNNHSKHNAFVRDLIREVAGFAPYERRIMELLKNSRDKRARKLGKKRLGTLRRSKKKIDELSNVLAASRRN
ncbi:ribosomal protein L36 [Coemansia sp. RSA 2711]|nr:ribosomal protein L36 [Coemansia sp. RSA 2711]KAJ2315588.1 ribosomal protein L36 [Coemansia sp. RSA 2705]KAJ2321075.1 ribosomal protein L36 [Coemansia sp. RSA 2704]KAJ2370413.1 ribosomal protein L36 [Coemansia sp. RSA 2610]KAJ2393583.1 ribosomal protein L36 [Coemansia sp. RSA 2611]KAJ2739088.1 ribosomal protein L36 [Coemansia sp. Cherry 401B]